jgi:hypothetical protein
VVDILMDEVRYSINLKSKYTTGFIIEALKHPLVTDEIVEQISNSTHR